MKKIGRAMSVLLAATVLAGCGGEPKAPEDTRASDIKTRLLQRLDVLEQEVEADAVSFDTVISIIKSLEYLRGHMEREGKGTPEQRERILDFMDAFRAAASTGGRSEPPRNWQPTEENPEPPPPVHHKIASAPFGQLIPQLREFLQSID